MERKNNKTFAQQARPAAFGLLFAMLFSPANAQPQTFFEDDPILREPNTQDASGAKRRSIDLMYDLAKNLFALNRTPALVRAKNVNSIDEVPDSDWFTNRILARPTGIEEAVRGPDTSQGPAPGKLIVTRAKQSGVTPGFTLKDSAGRIWFVQFDAPGRAEAASGAVVVATKLFHTLGYFQTENHISYLDPSRLEVDSNAEVETPSGRVRSMNRGDIRKVLARADRRIDGTYRMVASLAIPGRIIGGFKYAGTRSDDPNDIVPHEHRRELRALKVFGAWTNLVDMKALNTIDTVLSENGRGIIRHYLQDVGSTFGTGALEPREWDEGYEFLYEGDRMMKRLATVGFHLQPWQTIPYKEYTSIGRFEGDHFKPEEWKSRVPTAAMLNARSDDNFWAARRVMAFSDAMIRAIVKTGQYSDPSAENHLAEVLIRRRDKIGKAYLPVINPVVNFALDTSGLLKFENAAVSAGVAPEPRGGYTARWYRYDNRTGSATLLGAPASSQTAQLHAPATLPSDNGAFLKIEVAALDPPDPSWEVPVQVYFRRLPEGWKLVGLQRLKD